MVHGILDVKCLQVYFILFQDNFIFGDVISMHMWEMSFAFKNGCVYLLDHLSYTATLESLTTIFKLAGYFSAKCARRLEEHLKKY